MKGEPHLVARAEQVAEAGLPLDTVLDFDLYRSTLAGCGKMDS